MKLVSLNLFLLLHFTAAASFEDKYSMVLTNSYFQGSSLFSMSELNPEDPVFSVPIANCMCSSEDYEFKQFFSSTNKLSLVGRLMIEQFIQGDSFFHEFINTLPTAFSDPFHFSEEELEHLYQISFFSPQIVAKRQTDYKNLLNRIPSNTIPSELLTYDLFNWSNSVVNCNGYSLKREYHETLKAVKKHSTGEICLIPGQNLVEDSNEGIDKPGQTGFVAYSDLVSFLSDSDLLSNSPIKGNIHYEDNETNFIKCGKIKDSLRFSAVELSLPVERINMKQLKVVETVVKPVNSKYSVKLEQKLNKELLYFFQ